MFTKEQIYSIDKMPLFAELYGDVNAAKARYIELYELFCETYGAEDKVYLFSTPGRTEIGGNHTDHNHGCVLAGSVDLDSVAVVVPTDDGIVSVHSVGYNKSFEVDLNDLAVNPDEKETTMSLIRGIAARFKELGLNIGGFKAYITSTVKRGSGLSSSASIEVLIGKIFGRLYNEGNEPDAVELAKIGQYAENVYFGKPCGLMDQTACAVGGIISIDFKDTKDPIVEQVQLDLAGLGYCLAVVDTGGNHADLTEDYASVPKEMKAVAAEFGKEVLRDIEMSDIIKNAGALRKKLGDRAVLRAIHFINDNKRVSKQIECIKNNDFDGFFGCINDSGNSSWEYLQNCMTTKNPLEQGITMALALTREYCKGFKYAARVHGGGFAGTIQAFLPISEFDGYCQTMENVFGKGCVTKLSIRGKGTICVE